MTPSFASIVDISTPLHAHTLVYPGDIPFERTMQSVIDEDGNGYNLSNLSLCAHTGTHVDAPYHFIADGRRIHEIPAARWFTRAVVIDTGDDPRIEPRHLEQVEITEGMSVLFRTRNCYAYARQALIEKPVGLSLEAARVLTAARINLVGIDWLSIETEDETAYPVHHELLGNDVLVLEGLQLHHIEAGEYQLAVLPLHLIDSDGAPARAVLLR